jgi:integrase
MDRPRSPQSACQHHVSGQAKVPLGYDDFYLGKHGTPESYARYYALLADYNANGKVAPAKERKPPIYHADLAETAAKVKLQLATAMRTSEIFRMRPCDIDRRGEDWNHRPESHKTEPHGKAKAVPILGEGFKGVGPFDVRRRR